eukprot:GEMP01124190.1.p1 GENE.GEMP01124190.1~~GEMP01124190.1.p1  ORF type:complete len:128 (+),score=29.13 GEMP01124190.1:3-386(+)
MKSAKKSAKKDSKKSAKKDSKKGKKSRRVSKVAHGKLAKAAVFRGLKEKTESGLNKSDLTKNNEGKIVSKKRRAVGQLQYRKNGLGKFNKAVQDARKSLGYKGFVPVGGKTAKGQMLLKRAHVLYKK